MEAVDYFVESVFENDTLSEDERKELVLRAMHSLAGGITDGERLWGLSMSVGRQAREAARKRKKK